MEALMIYRASDGKRFDDAESCMKYEAVLAKVAMAMQPIGGLRPDIKHGHYIQRDKESCLKVKRNLVEIAREVFKDCDYPVLNHDADAIHPFSILCRIIDDSGCTCLNRAWGRIMCINFDNFREYDQPFFALNPDRAES